MPGVLQQINKCKKMPPPYPKDRETQTTMKHKCSNNKKTGHCNCRRSTRKHVRDATDNDIFTIQNLIYYISIRIRCLWLKSHFVFGLTHTEFGTRTVNRNIYLYTCLIHLLSLSGKTIVCILFCITKVDQCVVN